MPLHTSGTKEDGSADVKAILYFCNKTEADMFFTVMRVLRFGDKRLWCACYLVNRFCNTGHLSVVWLDFSPTDGFHYIQNPLYRGPL